MLGKIGRRLSLQSPPEKSTWGPLLICIAPNGCGKSTFLKGLGEKVYEISTEESKSLYETVAIPSVCNLWVDGSPKKNPSSTLVYGLSLYERILELKNTELYYLVMLFSKKISMEEFKVGMSNIYSGVPITVVESYLKVIEMFVKSNMTLTTNSIDIFIAEAVTDARTASLVDLKRAIKTEPNVLCWSSNTLSGYEPTDFQDILTIASKYQRVVRFIRWGEEIFKVSMEELIRRNMYKFLKTGRFLELKKLYSTYQQCESLLQDASLTHADLSRLIGFTMDEMGRVTEINNQPTTPKKPQPIETTPWSKWTNTSVIESSSASSPGNVNKSVERKTSVSAIYIEKLAAETSTKSSKHSTPAGSPYGPHNTSGYKSPSFAKRVNSVSEMIESVEKKENSTKTTPSLNNSGKSTSHVLTPQQQDEADRQVLADDWKRAVEEAQKAAEQSRLERNEQKKLDEMRTLLNQRKTSLRNMNEQARIEAELKECEDMDAKVRLHNSRQSITSPVSASGDSQISTTSADLDTTFNTPAAMDSVKVETNDKTTKSLRSLFGEISPVETAEDHVLEIHVQKIPTESVSVSLNNVLDMEEQSAKVDRTIEKQSTTDEVIFQLPSEIVFPINIKQQLNEVAIEAEKERVESKNKKVEKFNQTEVVVTLPLMEEPAVVSPMARARNNSGTQLIDVQPVLLETQTYTPSKQASSQNVSVSPHRNSGTDYVSIQQTYLDTQKSSTDPVTTVPVSMVSVSVSDNKENVSAPVSNVNVPPVVPTDTKNGKPKDVKVVDAKKDSVIPNTLKESEIAHRERNNSGTEVINVQESYLDSQQSTSTPQQSNIAPVKEEVLPPPLAPIETPIVTTAPISIPTSTPVVMETPKSQSFFDIFSFFTPTCTPKPLSEDEQEALRLAQIAAAEQKKREDKAKLERINSVLNGDVTPAPTRPNTATPSSSENNSQRAVDVSDEEILRQVGVIGSSTPKNDDNSNSFFRFMCVTTSFKLA